jgi:hypothetical protein
MLARWCCIVDVGVRVREMCELAGEPRTDEPADFPPLRTEEEVPVRAFTRETGVDAMKQIQSRMIGKLTLVDQARQEREGSRRQR